MDNLVERDVLWKIYGSKEKQILGFRKLQNEDIQANCSVLGYYVASSDNLLPTFRDNPSVSSSGV